MESSRLPRGLRNGNPLNIRHTKGSLWNGQIGNDGAFCIFMDKVWGYRAGFRLLNTYNKKYGLYSVENIIRRWAPPADGNDTEGYIKRVCELTGMRESDTVVFEIPSREENRKAKSLVRAMAMVENGCRAEMIAMEDIERGFEMAFGL